ncbi:PREDICTED: nuclear RNA export factor 1-like [Chrysochloris asiatica]|uniref:Nuclear RNA export factor 1-like n=1 Tax=Chrysochloris asiatica TaxID=185453 RepID=A0A9B0UF56_CHRAS|nr:PREDICTED: nuclear RNA export factor 1-like [Chrysochloris asiatica]
MQKHDQFFIQDSTPVSLLKAIHRFWDEENQKVCVEKSIVINPSVVYHFLQNILKPEQIEQLKLAMNKWFVSQQVVDFQNFHFDPEMADRSYSRADLVGYNIDMSLNGENSMAAMLKIIKENVLELKSAWEFKELSQEGNSLCDTLSDQSTNIRFYWIYDYGDRQGLLDTYHDEACFSLTIPFNPEDPAPNRLGEYSKSSRNMKKHTDPILRIQLLKHKKHDIVDFLSMLPKTQHDLRSFVMDIFVQTEKMLCFSVNGLFKKEEGMCQTCICAFNRIIIATPARNSSLFIINEQLSVREVSPKATQSAFSTPVPTFASSSVPILSQKQQEMIQAFSIQSGMNLQWSLMCLEDNEWNYNVAEKIFTMLKAEGKIPEKAFK